MAGTVSGLARLAMTVDGVSSPVLVAAPEASETDVVFLHGALSDSREWQPLLTEVAAFARCLAPDLPGYGLADKPADFDYTSDGYARHLDGVLGELTHRPVHIVGHDLGGVWGLAWAAQHPELLASITLVSIGALPDYRWHRFARLYRTAFLGELMLATGSRSAVRWAMQYGGQHRVPSDAVERAFRASRDPGTRRAILRYYRATDDLGEVTVRAAMALRATNPPALVIWGRGDPYVPGRYAAIQKSFFPRAEVVELAGVGHYPLLEDPAAVSNALIPFLRGQLNVG